jgi:hypothetical protein
LSYLISVGAIHSNHGGVGARGYHAVRKGSCVTMTWGGIEIWDGLEVYWRRSTQYRTVKKGTSRAAAKFLRDVLDEKSIRGYIRLPKGWRIQRHANSKGNFPYRRH